MKQALHKQADVAESITCIFGHVNSSPDPVVITENGYLGRRCQQCGLIYISPRPTLDEIINIYSHDAAHTNLESFLRTSAFRRYCASHSLRLLSRYIKSGILLEIGAGIGTFSEQAKKKGFISKAIEPNEKEAAYIRSREVPCEWRPLREAFPGESFDAIYHCDVLSHLYDPISETKLMTERLRPGGVLMFETGNFADVDERYRQHIKLFQYPDHLFFFGQLTLRELLRRSGLKLVLMRFYNRLPEFLLASKSGKARDSQVCSSSQSDWKGISKQYARYLLAYRIGRMLPFKNMPGTVIVIARKAH